MWVQNNYSPASDSTYYYFNGAVNETPSDLHLLNSRRRCNPQALAAKAEHRLSIRRGVEQLTGLLTVTDDGRMRGRTRLLPFSVRDPIRDTGTGPE